MAINDKWRYQTVDIGFGIDVNVIIYNLTVYLELKIHMDPI